MEKLKRRQFTAEFKIGAADVEVTTFHSNTHCLDEKGRLKFPIPPAGSSCGREDELVSPHEQYLHMRERREAYRALFKAHLDDTRVTQIRAATNRAISGFSLTPAIIWWSVRYYPITQMSKTLRTVKNSTEVASVSRSKALTAAKNVKASRTKDTASAKSYSYRSAPSLVKK